MTEKTLHQERVDRSSTSLPKGILDLWDSIEKLAETASYAGQCWSGELYDADDRKEANREHKEAEEALKETFKRVLGYKVDSFSMCPKPNAIWNSTYFTAQQSCEMPLVKTYTTEYKDAAVSIVRLLVSFCLGCKMDSIVIHTYEEAIDDIGQLWMDNVWALRAYRGTLEILAVDTYDDYEINEHDTICLITDMEGDGTYHVWYTQDYKPDVYWQNQYTGTIEEA